MFCPQLHLERGGRHLGKKKIYAEFLHFLQIEKIDFTFLKSLK